MKKKLTVLKDRIWSFYFKEYRKIVLVPFLLLLLSAGLLGYNKLTTGEFIEKGISLKGGYTATIELSTEISTESLAGTLENEGFESVEIRLLKDPITGTISGYDLFTETNITISQIQDIFLRDYSITLSDEQISFAFQSATIADTFYRQAVIALLFAFLLMGAVVFFYFKTLATSFSIIFSTLSDVLCVLAFMNLFGMKLSIASLGALLMIIGYSADSDVILATNIIKRKDGTLEERMKRAIKTEIIMNIAALSVYTLMFIFSNVQMIKEIAFVLLLGILFDIINTWLGNANIQRILAVDRK